MELKPSQAAFLKEEMERIESDDTRPPTARVEAGTIREKADSMLTE
jgi:hypothetical protein